MCPIPDRRPLDPEEGDNFDEALYVVAYDESSSLILDDELGYLLDQLSTERERTT